MNEDWIISYLLGTCEALLHSRDNLLRIAVNVEDWQEHYNRGLEAPGSWEQAHKELEPIREAVALVQQGASIEVLRAMRLASPSKVM